MCSKMEPIHLDTTKVQNMLRDYIGSIRGVICGAIGDRCFCNNNKGNMVEYDQRFILYMDENNLYV